MDRSFVSLRRSFITLGLVAVAVAAFAPAALWADGTETFNFVGTLSQSAGTVTGQFTLDVNATLGTVTIEAFDFTTPLGSINSTNATSPAYFFLAESPTSDFLQLSFDASDGNFLNLLFETSLTSLDLSSLYTAPITNNLGFTFSSQLGCVVEDSSFCSGGTGVPTFVSGSAVAAPEPSSLVLVCTAMLVLLGLSLKKALS